MIRERLAFWTLLAATFAVRAVHLDQPIVENYVGRQVPTAMVARNLERGSGFLNPQLDTGPFPNLFLVEPPIYAQAVAWIRQTIGFDLEPTGRLVSAAGVTLAAWGLFGLVRRRDGLTVAFLALASFGVFPVMIRYGRAFQPDALMLGCVLAGLRGWDEYEERRDWRWGVTGGFVLAIGLALKITTAWALIPFALIVRRRSIGWRLAAAAAMLAPAIAWYLLAWDRVESPGSSASLENARIWAGSISPGNWLRFSTWVEIGRGLVLRSFTPVGFVLAACGIFLTRSHALRGNAVLGAPASPPRQSDMDPDDAERRGRHSHAERGNEWRLESLWVGWGIGCLASIVGLASKWHHAYYWMVVAPLAAVGVGRALACLGKRGKIGGMIAVGLGSFLLGLSLYQSTSTWRTPVEWAGLAEAADSIRALSGEAELIVAPEAVLYAADRRGFRLEFDPAAARRAAAEWGGHLAEPQEPLSLTEFYRDTQFARIAKFPRTPNAAGVLWPVPRRVVIADVGLASDPNRRAWRAAIRGRPATTILIDQPNLMMALLH